MNLYKRLSATHKKWGYFFLLALYFALILDGRPFATPDEARYVEIPREMISRGNYITPHLNGYKYFEKPALFYWVQAGMMRTLGSGEVAMRLSLFFIALSLCAAIFFVSRKIKGDNFAYLATSIFAFNPFTYVHLHLIILDIPLTLFTTFSYLSFYLAIHAKGIQRRLLIYIFSASCALGILTKGVVTLALVGPVILLWLTLTKSWQRLLPLYLPSSLALFLAIVLPWHVLAALKNSDFLYKYFYVEHFLRYTTSIHKRDQGWYFFLPFIIGGFLPWSLICIGKIKNLFTRNDPFILFCSLWVVWILLFYSLSSSKLIPYILPLFPALSILTAHLITHISNQNITWISYVLCGLGLIIILGSGYVQHQEIHGSITFYTSILGIILVLCASLLYLYKRYLTPLLIVCGLCMSLTAHFALPHVQKPSIKPLISVLKEVRRDHEPVVSFGTYLQDLPYYLNENVYVFEHLSELEYGQAEDVEDSRFIANKQELFKTLKQHRIIWLVMRKAKWHEFDFAGFNVIPVWQNQHYTLVKCS